jgi:hypothetical protein
VEVRWSLGLYYRRFRKWEETATEDDWRRAEEEYLRFRDDAMEELGSSGTIGSGPFGSG